MCDKTECNLVRIRPAKNTDVDEHYMDDPMEFHPDRDSTSKNVEARSAYIQTPFEFCYGEAYVRTFQGSGYDGNDGDTDVLLKLDGMQVGPRTGVRLSNGRTRIRIHVVGDNERLQLARLLRSVADYLDKPV